MQGGDPSNYNTKLPYNQNQLPPDQQHLLSENNDLKDSDDLQQSSLDDIDCLINGEYTVSCRRDSSDEIYMPFSFIAKYFEVSHNPS